MRRNIILSASLLPEKTVAAEYERSRVLKLRNLKKIRDRFHVLGNPGKEGKVIPSAKELQENIPFDIGIQLGRDTIATVHSFHVF